MSDLRSSLERARETFPTPDLPLERVLRRRERLERHRRIRAGILAMAIAIVAIAAAIRMLGLERDAVPLGPPGNGTIVVRDGGRLIEMGPDGRNPIQLMDDPVLGESCPADAGCIADTSYAWSADGAFLALVAGPSSGPHTLYTNSADGGEPQRVASCNGRCTDIAWSPDGHRLAFAAGNTITVVDVDTGERTQIRLAPCDDYCVISPPSPLELAWSPDGSRIASVSDYSTITVSAADGSAASMLVEPGRDDPQPEELAWSSDGSIVFSTRRRNSEEREGIWSLDAQTGVRVHLVDVGSRPSIHGLLAMPDGSVVWEQAAGPCPNPGCPFGGSIWIAGPDGADPHVLVDAGCCTSSYTNDAFTGPVLSPDGTELVFTVSYGRDRVAESGVYVMNLDGTGIRRIANTGSEPAWQPIP